MRAKIVRPRWFLFAVGILIISSCAPKTPIQVGFVANLTGSGASVGVDGRDGAILAVEEINSLGGIDGHPIELIVRDDLGTSQGAIDADQQLIDEGVSVIVGHMTSNAMMAAWPVVKDSGVVFVSPTVSTPQLSRLDDNFFRLIPAYGLFTERLATYAITDLGIKRIAIFYDIDNAAFSDPFRAGFTKDFISSGGEVILTYEFSSSSSPDFRSKLAELNEINPEGLFAIASPSDTALIAQQLRLVNMKVQLFTTNWALANELIEKGGTAVDGVIALAAYDENNTSLEFVEFSKKFQERFKRTPTFASGYGYEAIMVISEGLRKTNGQEEGLKEALLAVKNFQGINGQISFDKYGDVARTLYLISVRDGHFVTLENIPVQ